MISLSSAANVFATLRDRIRSPKIAPSHPRHDVTPLLREFESIGTDRSNRSKFPRKIHPQSDASSLNP